MDTISSTTSGLPEMPAGIQRKRSRNVSQFSGVSGLDDASSLAPSSLAGSEDENGEAYRTKRCRNNAAVRKSREKSKAKAGQAEQHLRQLKEENQLLEERQKKLTNELAMLKESFLSQMKEQIEKGRAFDAIVGNDGCHAPADGDNNNNNDNQSFFSANEIYFLGATENGYPTVAASDAASNVGPPLNAAAHSAIEAAPYLKLEVAANTTIPVAPLPAVVSVGPATSVASQGKFLDLKKEKEQLRKNKDVGVGLFKSASL